MQNKALFLWKNVGGQASFFKGICSIFKDSEREMGGRGLLSPTMPSSCDLGCLGGGGDADKMCKVSWETDHRAGHRTH